jgi:hypothetical protein
MVAPVNQIAPLTTHFLAGRGQSRDADQRHHRDGGPRPPRPRRGRPAVASSALTRVTAILTILALCDRRSKGVR